MMQITRKQKEARSKLKKIGFALLVVGGSLLVFGLYSFGSVFFTSSEEFFANSSAVMDRDSRSGFVGVVCLGIGGMLSMVGFGMFTRGGADPQAHLATSKLMPGAQNARVTRRAKSIQCSECGAANDAKASFCDQCGGKIA